MQTAKKVEDKNLTEAIKPKIEIVERKEKNSFPEDNEERACYRTDERYFCKRKSCGSWSACHKLIAEWMR